MESKTKFILTYVAGIVTGCVLLFVIGCIINTENSSSSSPEEDIVMFDNPRNTVPGKAFRVMQVLPDGSALASGDDFLMIISVWLFYFWETRVRLSMITKRLKFRRER